LGDLAARAGLSFTFRLGLSQIDKNAPDFLTLDRLAM
jgi:hypothetical protein